LFYHNKQKNCSLPLTVVYSATNPLGTAKTFDYFSPNSPADRAREVFKPSKDGESLLVYIFKNGKFWIFLWVTS